MPNEVQGERWQRLRAGDVEVLLEIPSVGLPRVLHRGVDLGEVTDRDLEQLALAAVPQVTSYVIDDPVPVAVLPEHALGWSGLPGVCGHRDDRSDWSPLFTIASRKLPRWLAAAAGDDPALELTGRMLATAGIQAPFMQPESLLLLHLTRGARQ